MDIGIYALAATLRDELAAQLAETRAGAPCFAVVHPGNMAPAYGCGCDSGEGMAWVRVVSTEPSIAYPQRYSQPAGRRGDPPLVEILTLELGSYRCYPNTEDNEMPPLAHLDSAARDAIDDAAAMRRAALCAFTAAEQPIPGRWQPYGPLGGIHGGIMTVTVLADVHCPCGVEAPQLDAKAAPLLGDPRFP